MVKLNGMRLRAGTVPYRTTEDGSVEILIVESRKKKGWIFPEGGVGVCADVAREMTRSRTQAGVRV